MMEDRDGRTEEAGTAQTPDRPAVAPAGAPTGNAVAEAADHGGEGQYREASTVGQRHDQAASEKVEDAPFHDLLFSVRRSVRYHMRRQAFFDGVGEFLTLMALIAASTTVLVRVAWPDSVAVLVVASVSVLAQALALTWTPGRRARQHNEIARSFIDLEQKMVLGARDELSFHKFQAARLRIEAGEPPIARIVDVMCHNELARAYGQGEYEKRVSRFQRVTSHFRSEYIEPNRTAPPTNRLSSR